MMRRKVALLMTTKVDLPVWLLLLFLAVGTWYYLQAAWGIG